MTRSHSDALVFFGATGDLAYKKIFPALQAMVKRGHLNVPVIGVAKAGWNLDQLKARPATASRNTEDSIPRPLINCAACCVTSTATTKTQRPFSRSAKSSARPRGRRTTWPFRPSCSAWSWNNWRSRAATMALVSSSKSPSAGTSTLPRNSTGFCSASSTRSQSFGLTITWEEAGA